LAGATWNAHPDYPKTGGFTTLVDTPLFFKITSLLTGLPLEYSDTLVLISSPSTNFFLLFAQLVAEPIQMDILVILGSEGPILAGIFISLFVGLFSESKN
jgi:hypothetical protein